MNEKRLLAILGSPHTNGTTATMLNYAIRRAEEMGYTVTKINLYEKNLSYCTGCRTCMNTHTCIQKDDMQEIYDLLKEAEMLVIASPIYYHGVSGQLKCVLDRFYSAAYPRKPKNLKKVAMFLSSGDADMYEGAMFSYQGDFLDYLGLEDMGVFTAHGSENGSAAKLDELRNFGASL